MLGKSLKKLCGFATLALVLTVVMINAAPAQIIYYNHCREVRRAEKEKARNEHRKQFYDSRRHIDNTFDRAGCPQVISKHAAPSDTGAYTGYYVGGGVRCSHVGHGPGPADGTWGWDYSGCLFQRCIKLLWSNNNRYQDGIGAYKVDGPRPYYQLKLKKEEERKAHSPEVHSDH